MGMICEDNNTVMCKIKMEEEEDIQLTVQCILTYRFTLNLTSLTID